MKISMYLDRHLYCSGRSRSFYSRSVFCFILFVFFFNFAFAQKEESTQQNTPKIGLVLSGGGSRGYAHIGVLKVLEELNIQPDYITGTSQGALIGALYSLGYSASSIEKIIQNIDWEKVFSDAQAYQNIPILSKKFYIKYPFKIFLDKGYIPKLPAGIIEGHELQNLFSRTVWTSNYYKNFDAFPIPFRCVASDLISGKPFVFKEGDLATAMRASMSVPALFSPIDKDSMLLIDGGIFRNFPVKECKEMGADIIIGVFVTGNNDKPKKEAINSMNKVVKTTTRAFLNHLEKEDIARTDILIVPELNDFRGIEMKKYTTIIKRGETAARDSLIYEKLKEIATLKTKKGKLKTIEYKPISIDKITIKGCKLTNPKELLKISGLQDGTKITTTLMAEALGKIYATNIFKKVTYQVQKSDDGVVLEIEVFEKDRLNIRLGSHYSLAYGLEGLIGLSYRNFMLKNSELRFKASLARSPRVLFNYRYKPFGLKNIAVSLNSYSQFSKVPNSKLASTFTDKQAYFSELLVDTSVDISWSPTKYLAFQTALGHLFENLNLADALEINYQTKSIVNTRAYFNVGIAINSLNDFYFPTKGVKINANLSNQFWIKSSPKEVLMQNNSSITNNQIYTFSYEHYLPISKKISLIPEFRLGNITQTPFVTQKFFFGGLNHEERPNRVNFGGLENNARLANKYCLASLGFQFNLGNSLFLNLKGQALYLNDFTLLQTDTTVLSQNTIWNIQTTASYKTLLGPIRLSLSKNLKQKGVIPSLNIGVRF